MTPDGLNRWLTSEPRRPLVMGILNVTPDSFSDGGRFDGVGGLERALSAVADMVESGADLIDIGGESTRPGSDSVSEGEQLRRILPIITAVKASGLTISVDTTRAAVAESALDAGAAIVNDISAGRDDSSMLPLVARRGVPIVLMHMQGTPATMQVNPQYSDVVSEVLAFFRQRMQSAVDAGINASRIILDPGIGFGKSTAHNLELLRRLKEFTGLGRPILVGASRKAFIAKICGHGLKNPEERMIGTAATVAWSIASGAGIVRVHDIAPMVQVTRMIEAIVKSGAA